MYQFIEIWATIERKHQKTHSKLYENGKMTTTNGTKYELVTYIMHCQVIFRDPGKKIEEAETPLT